MMYELSMTYPQRLVYAVEQAREGAIGVGTPAYIHQLGEGRFLVNSQPTHNERQPLCMVLPNLDVLWCEEEELVL